MLEARKLPAMERPDFHPVAVPGATGRIGGRTLASSRWLVQRQADA